ncbi:hydantoinase/oxoprolinase N-terminal domain-containing protein [Listeria seeligeri]|uniref:hydantoinase/oxoprolinase N-terminal domain-containing protein n=1 Tax=Listeria seeligeri TaxID=1640 RepID=UPI0016281742|nr:hydantoinase/oxoprolinase family protein [Listeria seeligeri]MBC1442859.1 hydantoinase/oxoprolinase family protein [Listeria seeligeri]MBC1737338.1 hydantoinase/oxoprolinase family protein [Listeria seeligeri]MBC1764409.1 hydantoinase/oxoprolinase family protein [Listeria seeligeri]MBC1772452.1 hydantoinase/oxoprolinase family protein [Listeria seeligeri]MBC1882240.1 hydantoinase/oxoprolinase family protein [Listeria seeligeri]
MYKIGIDVGGTNTDAVILDENQKLIHSVKMPTSEDIETGITESLHRVLSETGIDRSKVTHAMLGTTQCTNAIVERKKLAKVGVFRLGYPATASVLPYTAWPEDMVDYLSGKYKLTGGGYEYDGQVLSEINETEIRETLAEWKGTVESIAVVGVFSSLKNDQELTVQKIIAEELGVDIPVSISSTVGSVGLIERENATILNAALFKVIAATSDGFEKALIQEGIEHAEIYLCQNDGTLMSLNYARQFPILTIACGPTNSIRGASYLAGLKDAMVLDVGGTTSDIGVLTDGFPRESSLAVDVGGVRTNFRMPDIVSIGLGGGSIVREKDGEITIGPDSVGYRISEEALVFGGKTMTTTDIAVRLGMANIGEAQLVAHIPNNFAEKAYEKIAQMTEDAIDKMKTSSSNVNLVLVGGGSVIIPDEIAGVATVFRDKNGPVANAIGASISQISGQYEQIYIYSQIEREVALQDAEQKAREQARLAGAVADTIEVVEVEEIPLAYHPGNATRLRVKVVGNLI